MSTAGKAEGRAKAPPSSLTLLPQAGEGNSQLPSPQGGEGLGVRWARRRAIARTPTRERDHGFSIQGGGE
jgi:hypothetical protein